MKRILHWAAAGFYPGYFSFIMATGIVVGTQAAAVITILLTPYLACGQNAMLLVASCMHGIGIALYFLLIVLIIRRMMFLSLTAEKLTPPLLDQYGCSGNQHSGRSRAYPSCPLLEFSSRDTARTQVDDAGALGCDDLVDTQYVLVECMAVWIQTFSPCLRRGALEHGFSSRHVCYMHISIRESGRTYPSFVHLQLLLLPSPGCMDPGVHRHGHQIYPKTVETHQSIAVPVSIVHRAYHENS